MSAGTLTLTNNSAAVAGNGTAFTTEVAAGDFIVVTVGGIPYTLPVKSVESGAALTLVSNFTGPTQSGAAWSAVPRVALNMVTAALVAQSAEALRGLNYDKQNWQQVYSAAGSITVKLPDGTTFTGPSWKYLSDNMATKSDGAVPVNQGGTGGKTKEDARTNLGLGNSSTRNIGTVT
ncbi:phage tail protein, partial [Citrobacter freundii]